MNRKSTSGYLTSLSKDHVNFDSKKGLQRDTKWNTNILSWNSKLQTTIALSTCEAKYYALKEAINEIIYLSGFLSFISRNTGIKGEYKLTILIDNEGAMKLAENPEFHKRTKHIDILFYYIREVVSTKRVSLVHVPTKFQIADFLTKNLANQSLTSLLEIAHVIEITG